MSIKLFCNMCKVFIKDVDPKDAGLLNGKEICVDCAKWLGEIRKEVLTIEKAARLKISQIHTEAEQTLLQIDKTKDKMEHRLNSVSDKAKVDIEEALKRTVKEDPKPEVIIAK